MRSCDVTLLISKYLQCCIYFHVMKYRHVMTDCSISINGKVYRFICYYSCLSSVLKLEQSYLIFRRGKAVVISQTHRKSCSMAFQTSLKTANIICWILSNIFENCKHYLADSGGANIIWRIREVATFG